MMIEHPEYGELATYGGVFDSYTIPRRSAKDGDLQFERLRYCHDRGEWVGWEAMPFQVITDEQSYEIADTLEQNTALKIEIETAKADRNRIGAQVRSELLPKIQEVGWQKTEPPKDGTEIVAVGAVIYTEECFTASEPFTLRVHWKKDESGFEGWHTADGMTVARTLEDEVVIHNWIKLP
jgi:hypothetical protein